MDEVKLDNQNVSTQQLQEAQNRVNQENNGRTEGEGVKKIIETKPGEFHTLQRMHG
jgi:hypothetical protein